MTMTPILYADHAAATSVAAAPPPHAPAEVQRQAAVDFAALLVREVCKSMRATCHEADQSYAHEIFTEMLDDQLAQSMAQHDELGLHGRILEELSGRDASAKPNLPQQR